MNRTTVKLQLSTRDKLRYLWIMNESRIRTMAWSGALCVTLLLIHSLLAPVEQPQVVEKPAIWIVATVQPLPTLPPAPTWTPQPTAEPVVIVQQVPIEVPVYIQQPVYVEVQAAPTWAPAEPPPEPIAPQQLVILDRQQWAEQAQQHQENDEQLSPALEREAQDR